MNFDLHSSRMFLIIFCLKVLLITVLKYIYINRLPMSWNMTNNSIFIWLLKIDQDGQVYVLKT